MGISEGRQQQPRPVWIEVLGSPRTKIGCVHAVHRAANIGHDWSNMYISYTLSDEEEWKQTKEALLNLKMQRANSAWWLIGESLPDSIRAAETWVWPLGWEKDPLERKCISSSEHGKFTGLRGSLWAVWSQKFRCDWACKGINSIRIYELWLRILHL